MTSERMGKNELFRGLPKVDEVLADSALIEAAQSGVPRSVLVASARGVIEAARMAIADGSRTSEYVQTCAVSDALAAVEAALAPSLRSVINATGIIIHTNLGRSVLSDAARRAADEVNEGYSNLEYRVDAGVRGSRHSHVEALLCELTGAEAAIAVNNNAAAVLLMLAALSGGIEGGECIVSRGQLVEIGGSFRIPDVMAASGAHMVEVGTTNKTHLHDYERAIGPATRLLFKAHTSNYRVSGFTAEVPAEELVALGAKHGLPVVEDLGSGVLLDLHALNPALPHEPTVGESVAAGLSAVSFSGDKLLGGPQAGIICGDEETLMRLRSHPIARAVRLDKMTLAALEATLRLYRDPAVAMREVPTLRALAMSKDECRTRAEALALALEGVITTVGAEDNARVTVTEDAGYAGGGALPDVALPGFAVALTVAGMSAAELEEALRLRGQVPIIARVHENRVLLNLRSLSEVDVQVVIAEIEALLS